MVQAGGQRGRQVVINVAGADSVEQSVRSSGVPYVARDESVGPPKLGSAALLTTAIPARVGALLNLRDIEQGLENLKRAPTAEADIQIEPSTAPNARPGDSDLVVKYVQAKKWRVTLSLDDSGTQATGRYQAGATVSVDSRAVLVLRAE